MQTMALLALFGYAKAQTYGPRDLSFPWGDREDR
jgi:hypothetical protein